LCNLGDVYRGLCGLDLAEEQLLLALGIRPILEQAARGVRDADVTTPPPQCDALANLVDDRVFLNAVDCPFRLEIELPAFSLRPRDWNEVRAGSALVDDVVRNAVVVETEMTTGLSIW